MTNNEAPKGQDAPTDEVYDTQMEVEKNPCGAWQAIQSQAARIAELKGERAALIEGRDMMGRLWAQEKARAEQAEARERALLASNDEERKALVENASLRHRLKAAEAEVARLRAALTPSGDTKAAYMGEIKDPETKRHVSWTAIKMIMAMIAARAALQTGEKA
jgi:hypothetical protein